MRKLLMVTAIFASAMAASSARADMVGAAAGAGTGLLVAGPPGAVVGGVVGGLGQAVLGALDQPGPLLDRQQLPSPLRQTLELSAWELSAWELSALTRGCGAAPRRRAPHPAKYKRGI